MKRVLTIIFTVILVFGLVGYASFADEFKVGLLVPGSIKDGGWCQSAYEGLKDIEKEFGAEVSYVEAPTPAEMKENFAYYGEKGFDLVIGHGFQYQDAALEIALEYPDTKFVTIGGSNVAENLAPFMIKAEDPFYLTGIIAAMISKTGKAGLVGAFDIPSVSKSLRGFELGAKSVDPDFEVMITYVSSWEDVGLGYEATLAQIKRGADVVFTNANVVELGSIKAAIEEDVWCFGSTIDKSALAPDNLITSAIFDIPKMYVEIARRVLEGEFKGEPQELGLIEGVTYLIWNEKIKKQLPQEVIEAVNKAIERIKSGEYRVPGEMD